MKDERGYPMIGQKDMIDLIELVHDQSLYPEEEMSRDSVIRALLVLKVDHRCDAFIGAGIVSLDVYQCREQLHDS